MRLMPPALVALAILLVPAANADMPDPTCAEDPDQLGCEGFDGDHPPCPTSLAGYAPETGGVFMSWTVNSFSDIRVYRDSGDGFEEIAYLEFPATRFLDHDTEPGETYRYQVTAVGMHQSPEPGDPAEGESPPCGVLEVTTVPSFPVWAALPLAAVGTGVWLVARRP